MSTWEFVTSTKCVSPTAPWVSGGRQVPRAVAWSTPSILSTTVEGGARTAAAASAWVSPDLVGAVVSVVTAFSISAAACFAASCSEGGMVGRNGGGVLPLVSGNTRRPRDRAYQGDADREPV